MVWASSKDGTLFYCAPDANARSRAASAESRRALTASETGAASGFAARGGGGGGGGPGGGGGGGGGGGRRESAARLRRRSRRIGQRGRAAGCVWSRLTRRVQQ